MARGPTLPRGRRRRVAGPACLGGIGICPRVHEHQTADSGAPLSQELECHVATHRKPAENHVIHAQDVEQGREIRGVDRHAVSQVRRVGLAHAPQVGGDTAKAFERSIWSRQMVRSKG